ncbi:alkene reductase [Acetobacteraceae bacterium ESL0709]|nr:alkene reductase [Acetobacteraceae bacterium ESL0697]MDF7677427.1 alkene reductase [Acetobacteraceae bacterium ESL0709]
MPTLFDPIDYGPIHAANRIVMAPLTRAKATREGVPTAIMAEYYAQRATAGLIISEATGISRQGLGWVNAPGIWNDEQVEGWKPIVKTVHDKGGKIVCQLWHMGRMAHSVNTGEQPVAPSPSTAPGHIRTYDGLRDYEEARALRLDEIPGIIAAYATAARNAIKAGFDGIQIHGANGYLLHEFLSDGTNHRTDQYGGSPENRIRLLSEVVEAVCQAIGAERVGVRLSPNGMIQGTMDSRPEAVYVPAVQMLQNLGIAWLELRELTQTSEPPTDQLRLSPELRMFFHHTMVLNQDYRHGNAEDAVASGMADAISFGRPFISNPDLVRRLKENIPFQPVDTATLYSGEQNIQGYLDYPFAP